MTLITNPTANPDTSPQPQPYPSRPRVLDGTLLGLPLPPPFSYSTLAAVFEYTEASNLTDESDTLFRYGRHGRESYGSHALNFCQHLRFYGVVMFS